MALFVIVSCGEEDDNRGQFPIDSIPPGEVTDITVQNEKGYSLLTFVNPLDEDLLYVEANYINSLGNNAIVRSSAFSNSMELSGFLRSSKVPVEVFAVDKSFNKSESTQVEIEPLDNGMFDIFASIVYEVDYGGIELSWINEAEQDVIVEFLKYDSENSVYANYDNFYTKAPSISVSVRGLEPVETDFGVVVRDEFNQRTDTLKFTAKPLFEEVINPDGFRELPLNPTFDDGSFSAGFAAMFNGITAGNSYNIFGSGIDKVYFTMDMGAKINFSRFKMWVRQDFIYAHSQPRHIVLLGTNDQAIANDSTGETGWETIGEWYDQKPSGNNQSVEPTEEDIAYFFSGMDFSVPRESDAYRYVRFVTLETWGKTDRMWITGLEYWGEIIN